MTTFLRHPLLWMAVTDHEALAACPPRERHKQATLGGFVISSSMLAAIGTFGTAREVGVPLGVAIPAALVVGVMIMNFDRHVLASVKRQESPWKTLLSISPRLLFAVAAGQVVTMAVLIFLFAGTIGARVATDRQNALNAAQALIDTQKAPISKLVAKQNALEAAITNVDPGKVLDKSPEYQMLLHRQQAAQARANAAETAALCELDGTCGSRHTGAGPYYAVKKQRANQLSAQATALGAQLASLAKSLLGQEASAKQARDTYARTQIAELGSEIRQARKRLRAQEATLVGVTKKYDSPLARWDALGELAHDHPSMRSFKFWLWLTLLLLDTSPALMKTAQLLGRIGPYEQAVEEAERRAVADFEDQRIEDDAKRELAVEAVERKKRTQTEVADYATGKAAETAKHRIDLQAATEREADRVLDEGQRARNLRDIEEWNSWLEPHARDANRQRFDEWKQQLADAQNDATAPLWADPGGDGNDFSTVVRGLFGQNGRNSPASN